MQVANQLGVSIITMMSYSYTETTIIRIISANNLVSLFNQEYIGNDGELFFFLTNCGALKRHLIEVNLTDKVNTLNVVVPVSKIPSSMDIHCNESCLIFNYNELFIFE